MPCRSPGARPGLSLSDRRQRPVRFLWQLDADRVARPDLAPLDDGGHDAGFADEAAISCAFQCRGHQARLDAVELGARVAQTGHLDHRHLAKPQARAGRQPQQIDAAGRHILTHLSGRDGEALVLQAVVQLAVDEMHLAQIGLSRVARHPRAVLDRGPRMRVSLDAEPGHQPDAVLVGLDQRVSRAAADRGHDPVHGDLLDWLRASAASKPSAICRAARRTAERSPSNTRRSVRVGPSRRANPTMTSPTGLAGLPPPGPATPVTEIARSTGARATAPSAIAPAVSLLTAPCAAIVSGGTPSNCDFASFE